MQIYSHIRGASHTDAVRFGRLYKQFFARFCVPILARCEDCENVIVFALWAPAQHTGGVLPFGHGSKQHTHKYSHKPKTTLIFREFVKISQTTS